MRLPVHFWAMLTCGYEVESCEILVPHWKSNMRATSMEGIGVRLRWRGFDGERCWRWRDQNGAPRALGYEEFFVRRMAWVRRDGRLYGEWTWDVYNRDKEWDSSAVFGVNRLWRRMGESRHQPATAPSPGGHVPQEVLRYMLLEFDWVRDTASPPIVF